MKIDNFKQNEHQTTFNAHFPLLECFCHAKAKFIARKMRKKYNIPKTTKITYTVKVEFAFNLGEIK